MGHIQDQAAQLALDLMVKEPHIAGFFAGFTRNLVEETDSRACGVWLMDDERSAARCGWPTSRPSLHAGDAGWADLTIPHVAIPGTCSPSRQAGRRRPSTPITIARLPER